MVKDWNSKFKCPLLLAGLLSISCGCSNPISNGSSIQSSFHPGIPSSQPSPVVPAVPPFAPTDISNITLWLAADKIVGLIDGDPIANWPDFSGQGFDAVQAAPVRKPIYKTNVAHGKPAARFDGALSAMTLGVNNIFSNSTGVTIFAVVRADVSANGDPFVFDFGTVANNGYGFEYGTAANFAYAVSPPGPAFAYPVAASTINFVLIVFRMEFLVELRLFQNGVSVGNTANGAIANFTAVNVSGGPVTLGGQSKGLAAGRFYAGDIAEMIVYTKALSTTERQSVETYLNSKYTMY